MHPWQRQTGEAPADFTAFVTCLRLKGRRSHRAVAAQTGRALGAIRRLSAKFNWSARVTAFEARLADASERALELLVRAASTRNGAEYEQLRAAEFQLAQRVLQEARRWLELAANPRRTEASFGLVCQVINLSSKLARLAAGMPTGDDPRRRPRREESPGFWTGPSVEDALAKVYGPSSPVDSHPTKTESLVPSCCAVPADESPTAGNPLPAPAFPPPPPNSATLANTLGPPATGETPTPAGVNQHAPPKSPAPPSVTR